MNSWIIIYDTSLKETNTELSLNYGGLMKKDVPAMSPQTVVVVDQSRVVYLWLFVVTEHICLLSVAISLFK